MGIFDDKAKLFNRSFPWGMAPYQPELENYDLDSDTPPPSPTSISIIVEEDGLINVANQLMLHEQTDPISSPEKPTFTTTNPFIEGLKEAISPFPIFGVLLFPTMVPSSAEVYEGAVTITGGEVGIATQKTIFPDHTPVGFVPCAGQLLKYSDGRRVAVPNLASQQTMGGAGDGSGINTQYFAPPGMAYMMKVEAGWTEMVPDLSGRELAEFGTPNTQGSVPIL